MTARFRVLLLSLFLLTRSAFALEGIWLGGEAGYVSLGGNAKAYGNALGFGLDLGLQTNPSLDLFFHLQTSSHAGGIDGLRVYSQMLSARWHALQINDFDITLEGGPGFYFFKTAPVTDTNFGLNFGLGGDVRVDDAIRVGIGLRYNAIFGAKTGDSYTQIMMRIAYLFSLGH